MKLHINKNDLKQSSKGTLIISVFTDKTLCINTQAQLQCDFIRLVLFNKNLKKNIMF